MAVVDYKCSHCGAPLKFNPKGQTWNCKYCGSIFEFNNLQKNEQKYKDTKAEEATEGYTLYKCPDCGAEIVADENTSATFCVYCKNTAILKNKLVGKFEPDYIIPFQNTMEDATNAFKNICKKRPLSPKFFSDPKNIAEMKGVYIPFWLFECDSKGSITANATIVKSWSSGNKRYTKTDTYLCTRSGDLVFSNIPVDGSKHFDNSIMNSIEPFDYEKMVKFSHSYLSGFLAEKYDLNSDETFEDVKNRAEQTTVNSLKGTIKGYTSVMVKNKNINISKTDVKYALLPVWMLNVKYKDKIYPFAMNGTTGKLIGNIPVDKKKAVIVGICIFVSCFALFIVAQIIAGGKF